MFTKFFNLLPVIFLEYDLDSLKPMVVRRESGLGSASSIRVLSFVWQIFLLAFVKPSDPAATAAVSAEDSDDNIQPTAATHQAKTAANHAKN